MNHPVSAGHLASGFVQAAARRIAPDRPAQVAARTTTSSGPMHAGARRRAARQGSSSTTNAAIATARAGSAVAASNSSTHARRRRAVNAADAIRPDRFRADRWSAWCSQPVNRKYGDEPEVPRSRTTMQGLA